jgi:hypothetical protein
MYFKEFLRVRPALFWYTATGVVITAFIQVVALASHEAMTTAKASHEWVELFGVAGFLAAFMATALGSTLALENDHLEVAWTRPRSRTNYATALMAVDAAAILIAQLIAFAFIMLHMALYHRAEPLISGPNDALNAARFALFPIAWYGLIVALSASMRGRANLVQCLIWPVLLGLAGSAAAPLPQIWHRIMAGINLINPLSYITYHAGESDVQIIMGAGLPNVVFSLAALALMVALSWFVATYQWRRLQV